MSLKDILAKARGFKGFRKPNKTDLKAMEEREARATAFGKAYEVLVKEHGIEIFAGIEQTPKQGTYVATLNLRPYVEQREPTVKPWHEAMVENLTARMKCVHILSEDLTVCERCRLGTADWGTAGVGVTDEYKQKIEAKIIAEKVVFENENKEGGESLTH